jgi:hypothetical protein
MNVLTKPWGTLKYELAGTWNVTIGTWTGVFVFSENSTVYWAENTRGKQHKGKWWRSQDKLQWQFHDDPPAFRRTFTVPLPLRTTAPGVILPAGLGFFTMTRAD